MKKTLVKPSKTTGKNVKAYYSENPGVAAIEQQMVVNYYWNQINK